jgi:hypothetical protein
MLRDQFMRLRDQRICRSPHADANFLPSWDYALRCDTSKAQYDGMIDLAHMNTFQQWVFALTTPR